MIKNDRSVVDFDVLPRSASKLQRGTTKFKALSKTWAREGKFFLT